MNALCFKQSNLSIIHTFLATYPVSPHQSQRRHLALQRRHECHPGSTAHSPLLSASVSAIFSARWTERLIADWPIVRITPTQR
jgi:hypothetical protein